MYWADGTIYRGYWDEGLQTGIGLMIFTDGQRKAGFFENNIYTKPLLKMEEFEKFIRTSKLVHKKSAPETFKQEIKEYLGLLGENEDHSHLIGKELFPAEVEDKTDANQLANMQEHGLAQFGPGFGISKEEYAK